MNTLKNIAKKAIAVGSGAVVLGATAGSAVFAAEMTTGLDLANYPAPFIKNGVFDGLLVIGEKAATTDVLGSIEIASSLQAAATTPVSGGGSSGPTTTLTGDVKQIESSGDFLEIGEALGDVTESLTEDDLEMLKDGSITTQSGNTDYEQTLRLTAGGGGATVLLDEDNDKDTGVYLFFDGSSQLFDYTLDFTSGLESDVDTDDNAEDIEDESIFMLGQYYSVTNTDVEDTGSEDITLELIAGDVTDTLAEGETGTYTVNGKDYEVSVLVIGTKSDETTVKFTVNGEVTDALTDGETDTLSDGLELGVRDIIETTAYRESDPSSIVEFYLGANKIEITDTEADTNDGAADFEINSESIEEATGDINAEITAGNVRINSIDYQLDLDAADDTDVYLHEGEGLRDMLDEPQGMLGDWDIVYQGTTSPTMTDLQFESDGDDQYNLIFTNLKGDTFDVPYYFAGPGASVTNDGSFGDEDDGFFFTERDANTDGNPDVAADYPMVLDSYFALTDVGGTGTADNGDDSYVLQWTDIDTGDHTLSFDNLGGGNEVKATFSGDATVATAGAPVTGDITIGGKDFTFWAYNDGGTYRLAVDLDNSGSTEAGSILDIVVKGGGIVTLSNETVANVTVGNPDGVIGSDFFATLTTDADDVDSDVSQATRVLFTESGSDVDVDFSSSNAGGTGTWYYDDDSDADTETGINGYGTWFKKTNDDEDADDLTISYPDEQVEALVYVTSGAVKSSSSGGSSGGAARVNKINVGSAVLDSDVTYDQDNMIVVGGPCVNTVAAQLMKNPADCAEGFSEGHAWIKLFDTGAHTALLVAGYAAADTQRASRVLAEYDEHSLDGESVDVSASTDNKVIIK